jgi:rubrerythrin
MGNPGVLATLPRQKHAGAKAMSDPKSGNDHPHKPKLNPGDQADPDTPGAGENVCRECNGTGKLDDKECPICGGTGVVIEEIGGA